jgi:hypothetical protein
VNRIFSWNLANVRHVAKHGVHAAEAEYVVRSAGRGFPRKIGDGKWLVKGQTNEGRRLQVIFIYPDDDDVDVDSLSLADLIDYSQGHGKVVYVIQRCASSRGKNYAHKDTQKTQAPYPDDIGRVGGGHEGI